MRPSRLSLKSVFKSLITEKLYSIGAEDVGRACDNLAIFEIFFFLEDVPTIEANYLGYIISWYLSSLLQIRD